jgi:hypothetical protein
LRQISEFLELSFLLEVSILLEGETNFKVAILNEDKAIPILLLHIRRQRLHFDTGNVVVDIG